MQIRDREQSLLQPRTRGRGLPQFVDGAVESVVLIRGPRDFAEDVEPLRILLGGRARQRRQFGVGFAVAAGCGAARRPARVPPPDGLPAVAWTREFAIFVGRVVVALALSSASQRGSCVARLSRAALMEVSSAPHRPRPLPPRSACCSRRWPGLRRLSRSLPARHRPCRWRIRCPIARADDLFRAIRRLRRRGLRSSRASA